MTAATVPTDTNPRSLYRFSMIFLIRPLRTLDQDLPSFFQDPADLLALNCEGISSELRLWESAYPRDFERGSDLTMWFYYMNAFDMLPLLEDYHTPFVQSCRFFYRAFHWPACTAVLEELKAVSQQTGRALPQPCELYLTKPSTTPKVDNFPVSWRIKEEVEITEILLADEWDSENIRVELGDVIARWSTSSLTALISRSYTCKGL